MASALKWDANVLAALNAARSVDGVSIQDVLGPVFVKSKEELLTAAASPPQVLVNLAVFYLRSNFTLYDVSKNDTENAAFKRLCNAVSHAEPMRR